MCAPCVSSWTAACALCFSKSPARCSYRTKIRSSQEDTQSCSGAVAVGSGQTRPTRSITHLPRGNQDGLNFEVTMASKAREQRGSASVQKVLKDAKASAAWDEKGMPKPGVRKGGIPGYADA